MERYQLKSLLILLMCADPWPVPGPDSKPTEEILKRWADEESQRHDFVDWFDAYHHLVVDTL